MTQQVVIYRKAGKAPRTSKAVKAEAAEALEFLCRVRRPEVEELFIEGGFWSLPELSTKCVDNRGHRLMKHSHDGWVVPASSLGRAGTVSKASAQSLLLWVKQNLGAWVDSDSVSIVVE